VDVDDDKIDKFEKEKRVSTGKNNRGEDALKNDLDTRAKRDINFQSEMNTYNNNDYHSYTYTSEPVITHYNDTK